MFKKKSFLIALVIIFTLFSFILIFSSQQIYIGRLYDMHNCIKDGQIPCRWVPALENSYGSPIFNYFPPLPYYFGELIFLLSSSLAFAVKIILFGSLFGTYIFMYLLVSTFTKKTKIWILPIIYTFISFLALFFLKEGLGLAWGLMLFPLIVLSLEKLIKKKNVNEFLFSSIFLALLILSSDAGLIFISLLFLWFLFRYIKNKNLVSFAITLSSIVFAFLLSAFYIFPSLLERNLLSNVSGSRYLPKSAEEKPKKNINSAYEILTGDLVISNFKQGSNWFKFETDTKTHSIIRLSKIYFPVWKIFVDGKEIQIEYKNNSLGLMTVIIGEGLHVVEGKLFDTPIRSISNTITIVSSILAFLLFFSQLKVVSYLLGYYRKRMN
ncbi:MAG: 6-pyruvoyl-tetrahydropterin synthase-related protein [Candidatus Daviesbacteria bacterium]|nr:6-pyruvoyl-tetrahydropterin synthase-related protein [Candidatus Daviesbacteria bacterium]